MKLKERLEQLFIVILFSIPLLLVPWTELPLISDFCNYYAASNLMQSDHFNQIYNNSALHHVEQFLRSDSTRAYLPFLTPPICPWVFYPLAWLKFRFALYAWTIASALIASVSYLILCSSCAITGVKKLWLAAFIAASGPYIEAIRLGQLSSILLFALTLLFVNLNKRHYSGAVVSQCLLWLKPHLLLPLLCFELTIRLKKLVTLTFVIGFISLLLTCLFAGFGIIANYTHLLSSSNEIGSISTAGWINSPTLRGQLLKFSFGQALTSQIATGAYLLLLATPFMVKKWINFSNSSSNILFTSIVPLSLCFALHLYNYDLLLLIPGILLLSSYSLKGFAHKLRIFILGLTGLVFMLPVYIYLHYFYVARGSLFNPFFILVMVFAVGAFIIEQQRSIDYNKSASTIQ